MRAIPVWLWPNVFSLDAPLIAVAWQALLSRCTGTPLRPAARVILFLTVWLIYIVDRLLDARRPPTGPEPARHLFYRHHHSGAILAAAAIFLADAILILFELHPAVFRTGLLAFAGVSFYFVVLHATAMPFPKEVAVGLLFTVGTFLVAFTRSTGSAWYLLPYALPFFLLCLANLVAIEYWEGATQMALGRGYLLWVPALALCPFAIPGLWWQAIAVSALALSSLHLLRRRVSLAARRVLVDAVLLLPPLLLL